MENHLDGTSVSILTSTMDTVLSEENDGNSVIQTADAVPSSSSDAHQVDISFLKKSPEDPISSTSDLKAADKKSDLDAELFSSSLSDLTGEKITENVDDLVSDLENLLGESTEDYNISTNKNELDDKVMKITDVESKTDVIEDVQEIVPLEEIFDLNSDAQKEKIAAEKELDEISLTVKETPADVENELSPDAVSSSKQNEIIKEVHDEKLLHEVDGVVNIMQNEDINNSYTSTIIKISSGIEKTLEIEGMNVNTLNEKETQQKDVKVSLQETDSQKIDEVINTEETKLNEIIPMIEEEHESVSGIAETKIHQKDLKAQEEEIKMDESQIILKIKDSDVQMEVESSPRAEISKENVTEVEYKICMDTEPTPSKIIQHDVVSPRSANVTEVTDISITQNQDCSNLTPPEEDTEILFVKSSVQSDNITSETSPEKESKMETEESHKLITEESIQVTESEENQQIEIVKECIAEPSQVDEEVNEGIVETANEMPEEVSKKSNSEEMLLKNNQEPIHHDEISNISTNLLHNIEETSGMEGNKEKSKDGPTNAEYVIINSSEQSVIDNIAETTTDSKQEIPIENIEKTPKDDVEEAPIKIAEKIPMETVEETPMKTIEETSMKTVEETPTKSMEETPMETIEEIPIKTIEETQMKVIEESPMVSEELPRETEDPSKNQLIDELGMKIEVTEGSATESIKEPSTESAVGQEVSGKEESSLINIEETSMIHIETPAEFLIDPTNQTGQEIQAEKMESIAKEDVLSQNVEVTKNTSEVFVESATSDVDQKVLEMNHEEILAVSSEFEATKVVTLDETPSVAPTIETESQKVNEDAKLSSDYLMPTNMEVLELNVTNFEETGTREESKMEVIEEIFEESTTEESTLPQAEDEMESKISEENKEVEEESMPTIENVDKITIEESTAIATECIMGPEGTEESEANLKTDISQTSTESEKTAVVTSQETKLEEERNLKEDLDTTVNIISENTSKDIMEESKQEQEVETLKSAEIIEEIKSEVQIEGIDLKIQEDMETSEVIECAEEAIQTVSSAEIDLKFKEKMEISHMVDTAEIKLVEEAIEIPKIVEIDMRPEEEMDTSVVIETAEEPHQITAGIESSLNAEEVEPFKVKIIEEATKENKSEESPKELQEGSKKAFIEPLEESKKIGQNTSIETNNPIEVTEISEETSKVISAESTVLNIKQDSDNITSELVANQKIEHAKAEEKIELSKPVGAEKTKFEEETVLVTKDLQMEEKEAEVNISEIEESSRNHSVLQQISEAVEAKEKMEENQPESTEPKVAVIENKESRPEDNRPKETSEITVKASEGNEIQETVVEIEKPKVSEETKLNVDENVVVADNKEIVLPNQEEEQKAKIKDSKVEEVEEKMVISEDAKLLASKEDKKEEIPASLEQLEQEEPRKELIMETVAEIPPPSEDLQFSDNMEVTEIVDESEDSRNEVLEGKKNKAKDIEITEISDDSASRDKTEEISEVTEILDDSSLEETVANSSSIRKIEVIDISEDTTCDETEGILENRKPIEKPEESTGDLEKGPTGSKVEESIVKENKETEKEENNEEKVLPEEGERIMIKESETSVTQNQMKTFEKIIEEVETMEAEEEKSLPQTKRLQGRPRKIKNVDNVESSEENKSIAIPEERSEKLEATNKRDPIKLTVKTRALDKNKQNTSKELVESEMSEETTSEIHSETKIVEQKTKVEDVVPKRKSVRNSPEKIEAPEDDEMKKLEPKNKSEDTTSKRKPFTRSSGSSNNKESSLEMESEMSSVLINESDVQIEEDDQVEVKAASRKTRSKRNSDEISSASIPSTKIVTRGKKLPAKLDSELPIVEPPIQIEEKSQIIVPQRNKAVRGRRGGASQRSFQEIKVQSEEEKVEDKVTQENINTEVQSVTQPLLLVSARGRRGRGRKRTAVSALERISLRKRSKIEQEAEILVIDQLEAEPPNDEEELVKAALEASHHESKMDEIPVTSTDIKEERIRQTEKEQEIALIQAAQDSQKREIEELNKRKIPKRPEIKEDVKRPLNILVDNASVPGIFEVSVVKEAESTTTEHELLKLPSEPEKSEYSSKISQNQELKLTITKNKAEEASILKIYDPENPNVIEISPSESETEPEERPIPKLIIKQSQCSPKVLSPLKITIKPIKDDSTQKSSPKLIIKPIAKPEEEIGKIVDEKHHSPKITIKPIIKPVDEGERCNSPKITIKPVIKPVEASTSPKIKIKPIVKPEEFKDEVIMVDEEKERIVLKITKGTIPTREESPEKVSKIKLKFSKESNCAHIVNEDTQEREAVKRVHLEDTGRKAQIEETARSLHLEEMEESFSDTSRKVPFEETGKKMNPEESRKRMHSEDITKDEFVKKIKLEEVPMMENIPNPILPNVEKVVLQDELIQQLPVIPPAPRKRGRPRKIPLVVREEFKDLTEEKPPEPEKSESESSSSRPKRSCRGPSVMATLGIKPRRARGAGRPRGSRGSRGRVEKAPKKERITESKLKLIKEAAITARVNQSLENQDVDMKLSGITGGILESDDIKLEPFNPVKLECDERIIKSDVVMYEEETRMSAETSVSRAQTPAKQDLSTVIPDVDESQSSVQSTATTESGKVRKGARSEVPLEGEAITTADQLSEYYWAGGGPYMLQEQVAQFLGIKSFKRKYPGIPRRTVDMQERDFIRESCLASEHMCDLGLTAVSTSDILEIMYSDFQNKYEEYCKFQRDRQTKDIINKQKALSLAANQEKNRLDFMQQAVESAAQWNSNFNKTRREERKACMDLQTFTINFPKNKAKQISKPKVGNYPIALVPGQYTDYYKTFTPTELNNLPINTMLYHPIKVKEDDSHSDGSGSDSDSSSSGSDSSDSDSSDEDCNICSPSAVNKAV